VLFNSWQPEASGERLASKACAEIGAKTVIESVFPQGPTSELLRYRCVSPG